jgi:hypothetical protein
MTVLVNAISSLTNRLIELVVRQLPVGKNMSTEPEGIVENCHQEMTGKDTAD